MSTNILQRLELDIMQANELLESIQVAIKYQIPAVVVHPSLAGDAINTRGRLRGRFKIITPVDWPKGDNFGTSKFRGLPADAMEADGFEICLTGDKSVGDTRNEAKAITEFIRAHLGELSDIRFVLGASMREPTNILQMCEGLQGVRTPTYIRTDTQLKLQVSKANIESHNTLINHILRIVQAPIKVSGNIAGVRAVTGVAHAQRFAVNLTQARLIVKEFQQQPDELRTILDASDVDDTLVL